MFQPIKYKDKYPNLKFTDSAGLHPELVFNTVINLICLDYLPESKYIGEIGPLFKRYNCRSEQILKELLNLATL